MDIPVAYVTSYYDTIGIAIITIESQLLRSGDTVRIAGKKNNFILKIESFQKQHEQVLIAQPGDVVGISTRRSVDIGDRLFLVRG